jgi:hypothetical protein
MKIFMLENPVDTKFVQIQRQAHFKVISLVLYNRQ